MVRSTPQTGSRGPNPLLEGLDITAKTITADALFAQRKLARYLVEQRSVHYLSTAEDNRPTLLADIRLLFKDPGEPDFHEPLALQHGRAWEHARSGPPRGSTTI